jgi:hypothetical protein
MGTALTLGGGVVIGIIIDRLLIQAKSTREQKRTNILEYAFGEPMVASSFSLAEVRDWITARKDSLQGGAKAAVLKANAEALKAFGKELDIGTGLDNYIVLAIVDTTSNEISESALVKYDKLDERLETSLAKGNGVLIVEA